MFDFLCRVLNNSYELFIFSFVLTFIIISIESRISKRIISFKNCLKISLLSSIVVLIIVNLKHFIESHSEEYTGGNAQSNTYGKVLFKNPDF